MAGCRPWRWSGWLRAGPIPSHRYSPTLLLCLFDFYSGPFLLLLADPPTLPSKAKVLSTALLMVWTLDRSCLILSAIVQDATTDQILPSRTPPPPPLCHLFLGLWPPEVTGWTYFPGATPAAHSCNHMCYGSWSAPVPPKQGFRSNYCLDLPALLHNFEVYRSSRDLWEDPYPIGQHYSTQPRPK